MPDSVLILADHGDDEEARYVADALAKRGARTVWFDTAWFPAQASITAELRSDGWRTQIMTPEGAFGLEDIGAVYYRQSQPFTFAHPMSEPEHRFATIEARFGLGGLLMSTPARWVSHPARLADAEYRPLQMAIAARCGLTMPASIITNDPARARHFGQISRDGIVYKAIMHKLISEADEVKIIYTTPVAQAALDDRIANTLHLFQANIPKSHDVRLVATGNGHLHAIAIRTDDPQARQDYRTRYDALTYHNVDVPATVAAGCLAYLAALDLGLGVFDFSVTDDNTWWFLECGPGAQWAWLQAETGAPIAESIADALLGEPA
jgi:hypothetical protein